jgi:hypothetical protein
MAGSESWIAPELPALTLLKLRSVALGQFERWGIDSRKARNWKENLWRLLFEFQSRLERHNRVEEKILYPKARDLEKSLYDAAIAGVGFRNVTA